ncbi:VCBS domain-containing protein [Paraglaciecola sp.]|uniref:VCBS domain-containing protein n=1 Tax=Paraglaciecola sp. TaxID=1920173 RepID=UPI0032650D96
MFKKSLIPLVVATALVGCGDDKAKLQGNSNGSIEIVGSDFIAGTTLSLTLTDPDGIVDDSISYSWTRDSGDTVATGTSYTITEEDEGSILTASALYTDEAGFYQAIGADTTEILPTLDVSAFVVKGPVSGASCDIVSVDDSGVADSNVQASATSDASGAVSFVDVHFTGTGLISCTGGTYTDESTGETLDAPTLRAVVDVVESDADVTAEGAIIAPDYIVSPLTEMVVQAASADLTNYAEQADIINGRFGIRFDTTETFPTTVGVDALGADDAEDADRYGSVLALISQLDADDADSDIATILSELVTDLSDDGAYSEATLAAFEIAQENLETTSVVAADIDSSLLDVIGSAVGYNNDPVAAIIEGTLSGTVNSSATDPLTGTLTIVDPNFEEDAFIIQTDAALDYGTFSIAADGSWSYTVDTENDDVAALELGDGINDSVTVSSIDGTTADIEVRVAALAKLVKISDTSTGDSGGIRINIDDTRQGKLTATILKENAVGSDGNVKDAYITIFGSSGSVHESLIDLRIQGDQTASDGTAIEPRFLVRNTDSDDYPGDMITADFVEDQFYEIDITWDLDETNQITVTIDGEVMSGGAFSTAAVVDPDFTDLDQWFVDGIGRIDFTFSDSSRIVEFGSFYVDNIAIYSDTAGTVSVFEDDFESYDVGDTLDDEATSIYADAADAEVAILDVGADDDSPIAASFFGLTGTMNSDETSLTGDVVIVDANEGEAYIVESTITGDYGTLAILEDGSWTYTLNTDDETISVLEKGNFVLETVTIESVDGTTADLVITVVGTLVVDTGDASGLGTSNNQYANVTDVAGTSDDAIATVDGITATIQADDTGELRIDLGSDNTIEIGRMTFQMLKGTESNTGIDGFILLGGVDTGSGESILDLRLDQSGNHFDIRNGETELSTFNTETIYDVEISWDASAATTEAAPTIAITIDGVPLFSGGSTSTNLEEAQNGVRYVQFRVADGDDITRADFRIDELVVYETIDGAESVAFEDDFEAYTAGESLDPDADTKEGFELNQTPSPIIPSEYNSNSFSVTVGEE